jgi:hypothetical protein
MRHRLRPAASQRSAVAYRGYQNRTWRSRRATICTIWRRRRSVATGRRAAVCPVWRRRRSVGTIGAVGRRCAVGRRGTIGGTACRRLFLYALYYANEEAGLDSALVSKAHACRDVRRYAPCS